MSQRRRVLLRILAAAEGLALVLAFLRSFMPFPVIAALLETGQFKLEGIRQAEWLIDGKTHRVPVQFWRHVESGALLQVDFLDLSSSELAAAACQHEVRWTAAIPSAGTFSGGTIGDQCWHWLSDTSARLLFCTGPYTVSLHIVGPLPDNVTTALTTALEDAATQILRNVR